MQMNDENASDLVIGKSAEDGATAQTQNQDINLSCGLQLHFSYRDIVFGLLLSGFEMNMVPECLGHFMTFHDDISGEGFSYMYFYEHSQRSGRKVDKPQTLQMIVKLTNVQTLQTLRTRPSLTTVPLVTQLR